MKDLDKYFNTPDNHFNENSQIIYWQFKGESKPDTKKSFEQWIKAIYEMYFFVQENANMPFACIDKAKQLSKTNKFTAKEQVLFLDTILSLLFRQPKDIGIIAYRQIADYRNELSPYLNDPEIINHKWHFDIDNLKQELEALETPKERENFLLHTLLDYKAKAPELDELEIMYYNQIGLLNWIDTELTRIKIDPAIQIEATNTTKPKKYITKFHVLTYLLEGYAKCESFPIGDKKELESIGNKRMGVGKGNTFYKMFNEYHIKEGMINKTKLYENWGENWRKAVLEISDEPELIETYLKTKQL